VIELLCNIVEKLHGQAQIKQHFSDTVTPFIRPTQENILTHLGYYIITSLANRKLHLCF